MAWTYEQSTGRLLYPNGLVLAVGYSGAPGGINDPSKQGIEDVGPIPDGDWHVGEPYSDPDTGPFTLSLTPLMGTDSLGRVGFKMHGDSIEFAGLRKASHGCIVVPLFAREAVAASPDKTLIVVARA